MYYTNIPVIDIETQTVVQHCEDLPTAFQLCKQKVNAYKIAFDQLSVEVWQQREKARFDDKTYMPLPQYLRDAIAPFLNEELNQHFAHVSKDMESIAFTASHEHGVMDRQTVLKPGRYLQRFFEGKIDANVIRVLASRFAEVESSLFTLTIDKSQAAFRFAYLGGLVYNPSSSFDSCMGADFPDLPCHPAEVYAGGDLAIAFIVSPTDGKTILARAVVWPEQKMRAHAYGSAYKYSTILNEKLTALGYDKHPPFIGARLLKIPALMGRNTYMMPHIDTNDYFTDHPDSPDHFLIVKNGGSRNTAYPTSGYMEVR